MNKPQIHASHLNTWLNCRQQYYRRYICGDVIPPSIAIVRGRSTHTVIEADMNNKLQTGELLPDEAIKDYARDEASRILDVEELRLDEKEAEAGVDKVKAKTIDTVVSLSMLHHTKLAPIIQPTSIERPWTLELDNYPYDLGGKIDLIDGRETIRDTKTKARSSSQRDVDTMIQLTVYSLAVKVIDKIDPKIKVDYLIAKSRPDYETFITERTDKHHKALMRVLDVFCQSTEHEDFGPCSPSAWNCTPKWCGY